MSLFSRLLIFVFFILLGSISFAQQRVPVYYTVRPQEGLYRVAVNNRVTMEEIRQWNHLASDHLSVGQRLIVGYRAAEDQVLIKEPAKETVHNSGSKAKYYTVQPQEGLYRVAVKNNVTMAEVRHWNNLTSDNLSVGQTLIVGYEISEPEKEQDDSQTRYEEALDKANEAYDEG